MRIMNRESDTDSFFFWGGGGGGGGDYNLD